MKKRGLVCIIILLLLSQLSLAENYANYQNAEIELNLNSEIEIIETGPSPKLIEAEGVLNLIPLETESQNILNLKIYSEPKAQITKEKDRIIFNWRNVKENKINYGLKSEVKTKNSPLMIKNKIRYPARFESKYNKYTQERKYTNINTDIQNIADELFKGETDLFNAIYKTTKYIEENIEYKKTIETETKVKRSSWVLSNKYGVCDELTNLFISILRAKNIPAKFISGVVYSSSNKKFENHGWAEVYFQKYGWLPFDLTYLQYGWVDITHIKLAESLDSGTSSIDYRWKSSDIKIEVNKLDISAEFKKQGDKITSLLTTAIEPIKTKVGFDSYVPVIVTVENPTDFYLTPSIYLTKSLQILNKNKRSLLLKPKEIKSVYFIVKVPTTLNKNYIYRSELQVETSFGKPASSMIEFSSDYTTMTEEEAENIIAKYTTKEAKKPFIGIDFDCTTEKSRYYENENMEITCVIKNKEDTKDLHVCLMNDCKGITLTEQEEKIIIFKTKSTNKIIITAEDEDEIKYSTISLDIIKIPNIIVKNIEPLIIDYNEEVDLKIEIESTIQTYNATIYLGKREILNTHLLLGKRIITTRVKGKNLINDIKLKMMYKDKLGKEYTKTDKYLVTIKNKPWYIYLFGWLL